MIGWIARQIAGALGPYIVGAAASLLALSVGFGVVQSWRVHQLQDRIAGIKAARLQEDLDAVGRAIAAQIKADALSSRIGERAEREQVRIRTVTRTVIEKVPVYVTPEADRRFPLSWGFVRVLDASILGADPAALPNPAGQPDDVASTVAPSHAATVIAGDFGQCREDRQRLIDLQDWVRGQQALAEARR